MENLTQDIPQIINEEEVIEGLNDLSGFLSFQHNFILEALLECDNKIIFIDTGNQAGKCLESLEFLYKEDGIVQCNSLENREHLLGTTALNGLPIKDDIYEVTFQNGIKIKCNNEHPFFYKHSKNTSDKKGKFISLKDLKEKEYVFFTSPDSFNLRQDKILFPKLLGYLCSDGYIGKYNQSVKFTNTNIAFLKEVSDLAKINFKIDCKWKSKGNGYDIYLTKKERQRNPVKQYIDDLKIANDSYGNISCGDTQSLIEFIKGFFNGDGYLLIRKRKSGFGKLPSIEIGFSIGGSRRKAYEFQYILWKLGIFSYVISEMMNKGKQLFYRVKVNTWSTLDMIYMLDWVKYPDKFKEAIGYLNKNIYKRKNNRNWISIKKIKYIGKGFACPISTENGELISYCGMKTHNTSSVMKYYIMRMWGMCPIEKKNLRPDDPIRTIRFASETLPMESDEGGEVKNTVYPQFKKFFPASLVEKDITVRKPMTIVKDIQGGKTITLEFVSYNQAVQSQAGVQRFSIFLDEHSPKVFYEEQLPRLLAAEGDIIFGITPVEEIGWEYEDVMQKAKVIYNSPAIIQYYKERYDTDLEKKEITNSKFDIAVIRAATDDNPTLRPQAIEDMMINYDDEATYETRRYGIFHQVSGVVYKNFESRIGDKDHFSHVISRDKYFPEGLPYQWLHARGIDYHEHTNWAIPWIAISPENEAFIYEEYNPSPDRMLTREIAREVSIRSKDYHYGLNLIDPLSAKNQPSIGISVLDDMNRIFHELHRDRIGTGGYWQTWDTKSERGYDIVKERLKNARLCGQPFNNKSKDNKYLPTLWILDNCLLTIHMFKNWKWEVWANKEALVTKEEKNKRQDKYSHFPVSIECIFKHPAFNVGRFREQVVKQRPSPYKGVLARA